MQVHTVQSTYCTKYIKYIKAVLIQDREADMVIFAMYKHLIVGANGLGYGTPRLHIYVHTGLKLQIVAFLILS